MASRQSEEAKVRNRFFYLWWVFSNTKNYITIVVIETAKLNPYF